MKKKKPFSELVIGIACMVLGAAVFIAAGRLQQVKLGIGPAGMPRFVAVLLMVLGAAQTAMALSSGVKAPEFNVDKKAASLFAAAVAMSVAYVLMVDIDKFKHINDTYGHVEGDEVLKRTASVLKRSVPRSYFIGRYGGDEFIIVGEASKEDEVREVCETIHENIEKANEQAMAGYTYTVSVGYAVRNGQITSIPEFVKAADVQLYQKKSIRLEKL